jgi:hypothetical protein
MLMEMDNWNGRYYIVSLMLFDSLIDFVLVIQEFTSFTVEKANLLNKRAKLASIAHYYDSSSILDPSSKYRHRHDISRFINLPLAGNFAMVVSLSRCCCLI